MATFPDPNQANADLYKSLSAEQRICVDGWKAANLPDVQKETNDAMRRAEQAMEQRQRDDAARQAEKARELEKYRSSDDVPLPFKTSRSR